MHIYRIYNSLTLDEYKYDNKANALIYGECHADQIVNKVGDIQLYYAEHIDDSEWIEPSLIQSILLKVTPVKKVDIETSAHLLNLFKYNKMIPNHPALNGYGYVGYKSDESVADIIEIDICTAEAKAIDYYRKNKQHIWLSHRNTEEQNIIKTIMTNSL